MDDLLQKRDPASSRYERPFRKWQCAGGENGKPCMRGPDGQGRCGATQACEPIKKQGRWYCTRSENNGGPCQSGPLPDGQCACRETPCVPELSAASAKRRVIGWALLLILGAVTLGVGGAWTYRFIDPGRVAGHHVTIEQCDVCHSQTMNQGFAHWATALFDPVDIGMENQGCVRCHEMGRSPHTAHSYPLDILAQKTELRQQAVLTEQRGLLAQSQALLTQGQTLSGSQSLPLFTDSEVACASCHKEHQIDQTIQVASCNACHIDQHNRFPDTHPEFQSFPYQQRTALIFDHSSHFTRHFDKEQQQAPKLCLDCHTADSEGRRMEVKPYSQTCAACHDVQITGEERAVGPKGIPFFVVPGIDSETLFEKGAQIGYWPAFAEGRVTPLMQDLLFGETFSQLETVDLLDLSTAEQDVLRQTHQLAWAVKLFLYDLITQGPEATLKQRLEQQLQRPATPQEVSALSATLPLDVVQNAVNEWFPDLANEVKAYRQGYFTFSYISGEVSDQGTDDGVLVDESDSILGDDEGILTDESDSILGDDEGILSDEGDSILGDDEGILTDEGDSILGDEDGILTDESDSILGDNEGILSDEGDSILGGDEGILSDEDDGILAESDILADGDDIFTESSDEKAAQQNNEHKMASVTPVSASEPVTPQISVEQWNKLGGWYRSEFALLYRPTGHSDQVMTSLISLSGLMSQQAFFQLTHEKAQGQCAKCHARTETKQGSLMLEWKQMVSTMPAQQLTRFRHAPHFATQAVEGCQTCHVLGDYSKAYQQAFTQTKASVFTSNFEPMVIAQCESCHNEQTGLDQCVSCHQYHPGGVDVKPLRSELLPRQEK